MVNNEKKKYEKRYKCPYCETRTLRKELADHIEKNHSDMIPDGYTAARVAFNYLNKKTEGHCIICGGVTDWNEDKCRYERLCNKKSCHNKYVKMTDERLKKATGKSKQEMLNDPEFQNKMLAGRSISGRYRFSDGGSHSYVGSYEKDFLQFMDIFMKVKSTDIISPGPTIEYYYDGQKHQWITDYLYTPYNLVLDIKDGGDNPNNRDMAEYRAKQYAKEKAITQQGKFNYLRLTNKQYDQLIEIMMELKESLLEDDPKIISKVYENAATGALAPTNGPDNVYIVNYMMNNAFTGETEEKIGICRDKMTDLHIFDKKKKKAKPISLEELKENGRYIRVYKYKNKVDFFDIIENATCEEDFIRLLDTSNIDESANIRYIETLPRDFQFQRVASRIDELEAIKEVVLSDYKEETRDTHSVPILTMNENGRPYNFYRDLDGVFIKNELTNMRSASYHDDSLIPEAVIYLVKRGYI